MRKMQYLWLVLVVLFCFSCEKHNGKEIVNISISNLPFKLEYCLGEELNLNGLIVEAIYTDNTKEKIDDYQVKYEELIVGDNVIFIEYKEFKASFNISIKNVEKIELLKYKDFAQEINSVLNINDYDIFFDSVIYGGYRNKDSVIIYDNDNFVKTNIYGYELAIDEFGYVIEANTNVTLRDSGYVISGHGVKATALKQVNVGDFIIYIDDIVFVYKENEIIKQSKIFIKFLKIIEKLNHVSNISDYNTIAILVNDIIPSLNRLSDNFSESLELDISNKLDIISNNIINYDTDYVHKYSCANTVYNIVETMPFNENNYLYNSSYKGTFYYGGFRNADSIVHYNKSTYIERNSYGYEIAVDNNDKVIEKGVLVSLPEDGYILSGHTLGAEFIKSINIGDKIIIEDNIVYCYRDTITSIINELIYERNNLIMYYNDHNDKDIPHDYKHLENLINEIDKNINNLIEYVDNGYFHYNVNYLYKDLSNKITTAYSLLIDYKIDASRAIWYYPFEYSSIYDDTSYEGVIYTLDKIKNMGFNEIIILPFYGDYILYDSEYFYKSKNLENFTYGDYGNDYLKCFIEEAHKRGILVTAFTQTFRCYGDGSKLLNESHYQLNIDGNLSYGSIYYYDICNDYVQDTLYSWYIELVTMYDFDKIEYDIIRYSESNLHKYLEIDIISDISKIEDPGYTEYSMNKFMDKFNLSGDMKELIASNKEVRQKWLLFKEEELINFIKRTSIGIKEVRPDIIVSAAVLCEYENAKKVFLQDYKKWLELGIVDQIEPMVYSDSYSYVLDKVDYFKNNFSDYNYRIGLGYDLSTID